MCVTLSTADDFEELTELWEASVRATHHFIPEQYILKLKPLVWSVYLRSMPVYTVRGPERIEGFMGINGDMLEMLFVHPQAMGEGVGKKLLKYAINSCRVRYVDVNEQNEQAYGFYRHLGFKVIGRDATDASGEPYPILHLKLKENMKIENWGTVPYSEAWERQTVLFNALVEAKQEGKPYENRIIFVEHPHVYTLGKSGKDANMLLGEAQLQAIGATLYHIDRGGDITYHGPGQLVCYPILNLEDYHLGLKEYIHVLEEAVIQVCASYGIEAGRVKGATGVWLAIGTPRERKICAMGVRSSHFVTMHGLALNVNTDLRYFGYINPCGFINKGVTSLQKELGKEVPMEEVIERLKQALCTLLS